MVHLYFSEMKEEDLLGVLNFFSLNLIKKWNISPLLLWNEMFNRLVEDSLFCKLNSKYIFHQIRVEAEYIKNTAFSTMNEDILSQLSVLVCFDANGAMKRSRDNLISNKPYFHDWIDGVSFLYMYDFLFFSKKYNGRMENLKKIFSLNKS